MDGMTTLKPYTVRLHTAQVRGRIQVQATCPVHAEAVAVAQTIEISYPKSRPAQWVVDGVKPCQQ